MECGLGFGPRLNCVRSGTGTGIQAGTDLSAEWDWIGAEIECGMSLGLQLNGEAALQVEVWTLLNYGCCFRTKCSDWMLK